MSGYPGHKYSIDFDHFRTEPEPVHYIGRLYVYSNQEIPTKRLHEILDEVERTLPKGLTTEDFRESLYSALEEKGLRRFKQAKDQGLIGEIKYEQESTPVPQQ